MLTGAEIHELKRQYSWNELADLAGEPRERLRSRHRKWLARQKRERGGVVDPKDEPTPPEFLDKKELPDLSWRELVDLARRNKDAHEATDPTQRAATVRFDTQTPLGFVFTADWHLGSGYVDYDAWLADIEFVLSAPDLYMIDLGDDIQNVRNFRVLRRILDQALQPALQARLLRGVIDELCQHGKLVAKVTGNHDWEFDERIFGEALQAYLLRNLQCPIFQNRGLLRLLVGKQTYWALLFHKTRFRSFMRAGHGAYREYQLAAPADIVAGGHDHQPGLETVFHYTEAREAGMGIGGLTYLVKVGTYCDNEFGRRYFHNGGFPYNATIVLWPNERRMQAFNDPRDAQRFIDACK
jgi:hypothetical protein